MADTTKATEALERSIRDMFWQTYGRKATEITLNPVDPEDDRIKLGGVTMDTVRGVTSSAKAVMLTVRFETAEDVEDE